MKLIIAYVRPERLRDVKTALAKVEIFRMTIDNVRVAGDQPAVQEQYRGADIYIDTYARIRFEVAINDHYLEPALAAFQDGGRTENDSDGHIYVMHIEQAVNISTGVTGGDAIA